MTDAHDEPTPDTDELTERARAMLRRFADEAIIPPVDPRLPLTRQISEMEDAVLGLVARCREQQDHREENAAALRESAYRLQIALRAARMGIHDYDVVTGAISWDARVRELWGLGPDEPVTYDAFMAGLHPDDREPTQQAVNRACDPVGTGDYYAEYRVISRRDGIERWVIATGHVFFAQGRPIRLIGTVQEITARKRAEEEHARQRELLQRIVDNIPVLLAIWDPHLRGFRLNRYMEQALGWTTADAQEGDFMRKLFPDDADRAEAAAYMQSFAPGWREFWNTAKDGQRVPIDWANIQLSDETAVGIGVDLRERKQAETALRRSEARWTAAIETLGVGAIIATEDEQVIYWNPAARAMHGFTYEGEGIEPLERTPITFELVTPDRSHILELDAWPMRRIKRGEPVRDFELWLRRPDQGWEKYVSYSGSMVETPSGERLIFLTVLDLTKQRKAEDALRESEERFRTMADALPQLTWVARADGYIVWYNRRWYEYTGMTAEQMEGWGWQRVHDPRVLPEVLDKWKASIDTGQPFEMIFPLRGADGRYRPFLTRVMPLIGTDGRVAQWFGTNTDITELREAQEQLQHLNATLEQRVRERTAALEVANKELEAFSYSVSHDLRAPLRGIDGFSRLLLERYTDALDATGQDYLSRVRAAAVRMGRLIDDMLNLSRVGRREMRHTIVDLTELAREIVAEMRQREPDRMARVEIQPGLRAEGDAGLLRIVLDNLLGNACKFTGKRDDARIEVGRIIQDGEPVFFVRDNGAGFDMRYADRLFTPFQRLHTEEDFPGTGIGLAIVQRIVTRHGGRVWAESQEGAGATIYFTLGTTTA